MKIDNIDIGKTVDKAKRLLKKEKNVSPALRAVVEILLIVVQVMLGRLKLNSKNSSKPPSSDPNRKKQNRQKKKNNRQQGGQPGHVGTQLKPVDDPDNVEDIKIDKRTLPRGNYTDVGFEVRQVIDFKIIAHVTEYRAQILVNETGKRYVAAFPPFVTRPVQYGAKTKANAVYLSQFQLMPYQRIVDYFSEQIGLNLSAGSLFNFNQEAYDALAFFESVAKKQLTQSACLHADETSINVNGKRLWLHTVCNEEWTYFAPHEKRGTIAMNTMGILPHFKGVLCHDHWKPYYPYEQCTHALCNAHHLRELEWSHIEDKQSWAGKMKHFLIQLNKKVEASEGKLTPRQQVYYKKRYGDILSQAEKECPALKRRAGQRGRLKQSKSRNLLERLLNYQEDVLRFTQSPIIPFTNNQGENDLRMTKVQQKISGCFRSFEGALIFCRIRSYLITCRKHGVNPTEALELLFKGKLPVFFDSS